MRRLLSTLIVGIALAGGGAGILHAQQAGDFYRGKTIQMLISYTAGGGYDFHARLLARHLGKYIPGNPTIVAQNYPGAAGLRLANYMYNSAPKDGTIIGMMARGSSTAALLSNEAVQFDARKFNWIGNVSDEPSICASWHTSKVRTFEDLLKEPFIAGAPGATSDAVMYTSMIRNLFGARIKIVSGYPGTNELLLALERGEVDGVCGWALGNIKSSRPDWIPERKVNLLMQLSLRKSNELPFVPLIMDLARSDSEKQIFRLMFSRQQMAWPLATTPDVPADRVDILRKAFDTVTKDPDYLLDAKQQGLEVNPMSGTAMEALIRDLFDTPAAMVTAAKAAIAD